MTHGEYSQNKTKNYLFYFYIPREEGWKGGEGDPFIKCVLTIIVPILYLLFRQLFQCKKKKKKSVS